MTGIRLDDIQPTQLSQARKRVIELHPGTAAAPIPLTSDRLEALRRRVESARGVSAQLESLAAELSPREVRALVTGLELWTELRTEVAYLLVTRARRDVLPLLWRAWQRFPQVMDVRSVLLHLAGEFGWEEAVSPDFARLAAEWVAAEAPGEAAQVWLETLSRSYSDLQNLTGDLLQSDSPFLRLVREAVMTHGSAAQLEAEGGARLLAWSKELSPSHRVLFGQNYLVRLKVKDWEPTVVDHIANTYGLPRNPRLPAFWDPIPEDVRTAFQKIFVEKRLKKAFGGDSDRYAYWKRWTDEIIDVQFDQVAGIDWAHLRFERFAVVEFFKIGHAAFLYTLPQIEKILRTKPRRPEELRDRFHPSFTRFEDNRIIHRGDWAPRATRKVRAWLRHSP